jgi:hypothetical protein
MRIHIWISVLLLIQARVLSGQNAQPAGTPSEFERQYQERIVKDRLFGVYIPKNLEDAIRELDKQITPEARSRVKAVPEDRVCCLLHPKLGQWMITNWGFYEGSRLSHYLRTAGVTYPDDMADLIIVAYHRHINDIPVVLKDLAAPFKDKRQKAWQERLQQGEVIHQEVRKKD